MSTKQEGINLSSNTCCAELIVVDCGDTNIHAHLVCGYSKAVLSNDTVIAICTKAPYKCLLQGENND